MFFCWSDVTNGYVMIINLLETMLSWLRMAVLIHYQMTIC